MPIPKRHDRYRSLVRHLVSRRRRDLVAPMARARTAVKSLAVALEIARRQADSGAATTWLKVESLRQRAAFEHALFHVVEAIGDESDGADLVEDLFATRAPWRKSCWTSETSAGCDQSRSFNNSLRLFLNSSICAFVGGCSPSRLVMAAITCSRSCGVSRLSSRASRSVTSYQKRGRSLPSRKGSLQSSMGSSHR
jgi:hypothetical protein